MILKECLNVGAYHFRANNWLFSHRLLVHTININSRLFYGQPLLKQLSFPQEEQQKLSSTQTLNDEHKISRIVRTEESFGGTNLPMLEINCVKKYLHLSKYKLNLFIVGTTICGYTLSPLGFIGSDWKVQFTCLVFGTILCSFSAASFNQLLEVPYDSQMPRTRNRVLPTHQISLYHAFLYATTTGFLGTVILSSGVNYLTGFLGAFNVLLYAFIYTPLKRKSVYNTWIGAIVGAIPPLMGWTGSGCGLFDDENGGIKALLLPLLIYCWQFPHFNALSWNLKKEYSRAGYSMLSVLNPERCKRVALQYSLMFPAISSLFYCFDQVDWTFCLDSNVLNFALIYCTIKQHPTAYSSWILTFEGMIRPPYMWSFS